MNALLGEVIKLMGNETITTAEMTNRLNRNGWGVRPDDVLDALHRLEVQRVVERLWPRKEQGASNIAAPKAAGTP